MIGKIISEVFIQVNGAYTSVSIEAGRKQTQKVTKRIQNPSFNSRTIHSFVSLLYDRARVIDPNIVLGSIVKIALPSLDTHDETAAKEAGASPGN